MLRGLRQLAPVRLLTTARRTYATQVNAACSLGFAPEDVFCRDNLFEQDEPIWLETPTLKTTGIAADSVLIDNLPPQDEGAKLKMKFLGIRRARYLQITQFSGRDTRAIVMEVATLLERVQALLGVPSAASQPGPPNP